MFVPRERSRGILRESTWEDLVRLLQNGSKSTVKDDLGGWCPAAFVGNHRRLENTQLVYCLAVDIDNKQLKKKGEPDRMVEAPASLEHTVATLEGYEFVVYSSFSHSEEWPRFRVVIPLDRPVNRKEYAYLWSAAATWLAGHGVIVDEQAKDPSRLWYLGSRTKEGFRAITGQGAWLPVDQFLAVMRAEDQAEKRIRELRPSVVKQDADVVARAQHYLAKCPAAKSGEGGHELTWSVVRCVVRGFNLTEQQALVALQPWNSRCDPEWSEKELTHKIRQAREAGRKPELGAYLKSDWKTNGRLPRVGFTPEELELMGVENV